MKKPTKLNNRKVEKKEVYLVSNRSSFTSEVEAQEEQNFLDFKDWYNTGDNNLTVGRSATTDEMYDWIKLHHIAVKAISSRIDHLEGVREALAQLEKDRMVPVNDEEEG